jgi:uncharacterized protein (TIGR02679 family)
MIPVGALQWLRSADLLPLWTEAHRRLTRSNRVVRGRLTLRSLTDGQRDAVSELLGHAVAPVPSIDLQSLDQLLMHSAAGAGLIDVVEAVLTPVPDRRTEASVEAARRAMLREYGQAALAAAEISDLPWATEWLDRLWRGGILGRIPTSEVRLTVARATTTLGLVLAPYAQVWSRADLAERVTGSAHGLDDDMLLTRLVMRGIAMAVTGANEPPVSAVDRRQLWEAVGVVSDTVATTVLTYGLTPLGDDWRAAALRKRRDHHAETHMALREIRQLSPIRLAPQTIHVCENPRVLEAAADAAVPAALICTMGNPTTVALALLDTVAACPGIRLVYHGDFDWPGVSIAGRIMQRYRARPWRYGAADYRAAVRTALERGTPLQTLVGSAVPTGWDEHLGPAMSQEGVAVHEEGMIDVLLDDLR